MKTEEKNRPPKKKRKNSFEYVEINKRDFCSSDRLFWKTTIVRERFSILSIFIGLSRLKDICEFHILASKGLR
jgi:hypothetical protein